MSAFTSRLDGLNQWAVLLLVGSSTLGLALGAALYLNPNVQKPVKLPIAFLQDLLAADFYTPQLYRVSIVWGVAVLSKVTDWMDRFIVDGFINAVGWASILSGRT